MGGMHAFARRRGIEAAADTLGEKPPAADAGLERPAIPLPGHMPKPGIRDEHFDSWLGETYGPATGLGQEVGPPRPPRLTEEQLLTLTPEQQKAFEEATSEIEPTPEMRMALEGKAPEPPAPAAVRTGSRRWSIPRASTPTFLRVRRTVPMSTLA
jgi:hypothetical protein